MTARQPEPTEDPRLRRALRALAGRTLEEALPQVRAIIGPREIPAGATLAASALAKLQEGEVLPTPDELSALELVIRLLRPVIHPRDCNLGDLPDPSGLGPYPDPLQEQWASFRALVQPVLCSVGRVESSAGTHVGTGFLVSPDRLVTNRHVLAVLTHGAEVLGPGAARVVFTQEDGRTNRSTDVVPIDRVVEVHPSLDLVVMAIPAQGRSPLLLSTDPVEEGTPVAVLGYPGKDPTNNPLFLEAVMGGVYGQKAVALGEVLDGVTPTALFHDCSTSQGNSGSPILSLVTAQVVGVHRAGYFMYRNEGIPAPAAQSFLLSTPVA